MSQAAAPVNLKLIDSLAQIILSLSSEERQVLAHRLEPEELPGDVSTDDIAKLAELRQAILIGFEQIQNGEYTIYTDETLPSLLMSIRERGKRRLQQERGL
jgi:hypothetical protein